MGLFEYCSIIVQEVVISITEGILMGEGNY